MCVAAQPSTHKLLCMPALLAAVSDVLMALDWLKQNAVRPAIAGMSLGGALPLPPLLPCSALAPRFRHAASPGALTLVPSRHDKPRGIMF